jgi:acetyltransferase-like isoleucine patch superfamily enzyme
MRLSDARRRWWLARQRRAVNARAFAAFGEGSAFAPPAVILSPHRIHLGARVLFHQGAWLSVVEEHNGRRHEPRLEIGDRCIFGRDVYISCVGEITIGQEVQIGDRVFITDTYHEYEDPDTSIVRQPMAEPRAVRIGDGSFLGPGAAVIAGVTIGERALVAVNAVVTRDVPPNTIVAGNPARVIRSYDRVRGTWVDA